MRALTQQQFISKAVAVHGNLYDYSETVYTRASSNVYIRCKEHNTLFTQLANNHLRGYGCPLCGKLKTGDLLRKDLDTFLKEASSQHLGRYSYENVVYTTCKSKVAVTCREHGDFLVAPSNHLKGRGCPSCKSENARERMSSSAAEFIEKASLAHDDIYDYSNVVYSSSVEDVEIVCKEHGSFWQRPSNHLFGKGCPSCSKTGYDPTKPGSLYVLVCGDITKVGITNLDPSERSRKVSKSFGARFDIVNSWTKQDGKIPTDVETVLLRLLRKEYNQPSSKFDGSSECFLRVNLPKLVSTIESYMA